jgi:hypothetical protein
MRYKRLLYANKNSTIKIDYPFYFKPIMNFFLKKVKLEVLNEKELSGEEFSSVVVDEFANFIDRKQIRKRK